MAYWNLDGARMKCQRCGVECDRNSFAQIHCPKCKKERSREHISAWKQRKRAEARAARRRETISCARCGKIVPKRSGSHKFCAVCREVNDREKDRSRVRAQRARNLEFHRADSARRLRERRKREPKFAIAARMSAGIYQALREGKAGRRWEHLVGYTLGDLIAHLERQFLNGMSWENYGEWHIDHIRPVSSFSYSSSDDPEFLDCWALTNLRPLWAEKNMQKSSKRVLLI